MSFFSSSGGTYSFSNYSVAKYIGNASSSISTRVNQSVLSPDDESKDKTKTPDLKPTPDTAVDARAKLTDLYGDLDTTSSKYKDDIEAFRKDIFDDLEFDRETLHLIASNENGYFSDEEIEAAKQVMQEQLDEILKKDAPEAGPTADNYLSLLKYLEEETSAEEQKSFEWAESKASAQAAYKRLSGGKESDFFSDDPVVNLLTKAHEDLFDVQKTNPDAKLESMSSYDSAQYQWERNNNSYDAYTSPDAWWK
ncbi:hypothetical protein [Pseudovibrio sp. Alg231-02]|uniref:hypothetical protein n=1 Tax=Pseudovibrio sp. Alg231-02 TaxID=1922223 RepID=UPI001AD8DAA1|nr:hypothetical protein [Pseudovibrio sp. Alg231-02]